MAWAYGMSSHKRDSEWQKMVADQAAIREAMLDLLHRWGSVENRFALLLRDIINDEAGEIAFAIYFTPSSMEVRFQIVDSALKVLISEQKYPAFHALWTRLLNSINRSKNLRNAVAHGQIGTYSYKDRNVIRLMPPLFDFRRLEPAIQKQQIPGLGANELRQSEKKMAEAIEALNLVSRWLDATRGGDDPRAQKTLSELEAHLKKFDPQSAQKNPS